MLYLFEKLKNFIKGSDVVTDSPIFRLHCKFTTVGLFTFSLLTSANLLVGDSIKCVSNSGKEIPKAITTWCWIQSKFTLPDQRNRLLIDENFEEGKKYHHYYQWVFLSLFVQGIFCYLPKFLWDAREKNMLQHLVMKLNESLPSAIEHENKKRILLKFLISHEKLHIFYVLHYWLCEAMCLVNVVGQIVMMNAFLGGEFYSYGWDVITFLTTAQEDRTDPMVYVFPKMSKCDFFKYGPSGTMMNDDILCILPINILNEKIYVLLWIWFLLLIVLLSLLLIYRLLIIFIKPLRVLLLQSTNQLIKRKTAVTICDWGGLSDFWIIYLLGTNIHSHFFNSLLVGLAEAVTNTNVRKRILEQPNKCEKTEIRGGKGDHCTNVSEK